LAVVVLLLLGFGIDGPAEGFGNGAEEVVRDDDGAPLPLLLRAALLPLLQAYPLFNNSFPRRGGDAARAARR
jgi:hypothetical protein